MEQGVGDCQSAYALRMGLGWIQYSLLDEKNLVSYITEVSESMEEQLNRL